MLSRTRAVAGLVATLVAATLITTRADADAVPASIDESTFLARVRERSPRLAALEARRRAATTQIDVARVRPNPTLSYEREDVPGLASSIDYVRLGWTVDLAGRRGLATAAARAGATAERHEVDRDLLELEVEARSTYLDALYTREHLARLDASRAALAELVSALGARAAQGDASSYDADRAALELGELDDARANARRALVDAQLRLGALVGEPGTSYAASGTLALPATPIDAATFQRMDVDAALAHATRAGHEARAAGRQWVPRLEVVGGLLSSRNMGVEGTGYVVGIGGELPVFDRGGAAAARARADAKRWRAEASARELEARGRVTRARQDLILRIEQAQAYIAGPAAHATDLARRAAVAYREGSRPILELLDVQRTARHAASRVLELVYEARRAELTLRRATGDRS